MSKICNSCKIEQPLENFSRQASMKDGYRNICKSCHNTYVRETWYVKNADKQKKASAEWKLRNRAKVLAKKYSTEEEVIEALLEIGRCQVCGNTSNLHIDHCHETGQIRGILCRSCNYGLGNFYDNPESLRAAADYLERLRG